MSLKGIHELAKDSQHRTGKAAGPPLVFASGPANLVHSNFLSVPACKAVLNYHRFIHPTACQLHHLVSPGARLLVST
jgi:hypothetical protein